MEEISIAIAMRRINANFKIHQIFAYAKNLIFIHLLHHQGNNTTVNQIRQNIGEICHIEIEANYN